jgi:hypothetical protein
MEEKRGELLKVTSLYVVLCVLLLPGGALYIGGRGTLTPHQGKPRADG